MARRGATAPGTRRGSPGLRLPARATKIAGMAAMSRIFNAALGAGWGVARSLWRVARALFHEITGALFLVLAFMGGAAAIREWRHSSQETYHWLRFGLSAAFSLMMLIFAIASFRSARRVK